MEGTPVRLVPKSERLAAGGSGQAAHGSDKEIEDDDPYELVGVRYPVAPGVDADRELARCFVEEYALIGWSPARVQMLFDTPQFGGAYDICQRRGPELIAEVIAEVFGDAAMTNAPTPQEHTERTA